MFMPMWNYLFLKKRITEQVGVEIMPGFTNSDFGWVVAYPQVF
jgi:hypothetical protein